LKQKRNRRETGLSLTIWGVIAFERGDTENAIGCWEKSLERKESPWALRNLAQAALKKDVEKGIILALEYYKRAFNRKTAAIPDKSFREEYIPLLLAAGREEEAAEELAYAGSVETLSLPLLEAAAELALRRKDDALLDRIFSIEPAHFREGKTTLMDIWIEREIRHICESGKNREEAEKELKKLMLDEKLIPPREIDFRMF
jgi:tetratricopeptide (TPR) repeat protein